MELTTKKILQDGDITQKDEELIFTIEDMDIKEMALVNYGEQVDPYLWGKVLMMS